MISMLLALTLVFGLAACGGNNAPANDASAAVFNHCLRRIFAKESWCSGCSTNRFLL